MSNSKERLRVEYKTSYKGYILVYIWDPDSNDYLTYKRVGKPGFWGRFLGVTWEDLVVAEVARQLARVKKKEGVISEKEEADGIIAKIDTDVLFE